MYSGKLIFGSHKKKSQDLQDLQDTQDIQHNKCTIFLIDTSLFTGTKISGSYLTELISDQYTELWKKMKRGDLVYDISCESTRFPYIVDIEKDQLEHIKLLRHGLVIMDPYTLWDPNGSVYPNMFTITEFPIRYFDNYVCYDKLCSGFNEIKFNTPCPIWLDVAKLKLNTLKHNNVFHIKSLVHTHYLYTVLTYKKINYLIVSKEEEHCEVSDQYLIDKFIEYFKDPCLIHVLDMIDHQILDIAKKEQVTDENILMILIDC